MARYLISEEILTSTADSIRTKLGTQAKIKPSEFATKIDSIFTSTGAFKVSSVQEMNALTKMVNGDVCVIVGNNTYSIYAYSNAWVDITDEILTDVTVTPTTQDQAVSIPQGYKGLKNVTVKGASLGVKSAIPSTTAQTITPDSPNIGLSSVTVEAASLGSKTITPTTASQTITPDSPNIGLSSVTVNPAPLGGVATVTATTERQIIEPTSGNLGFSGIEVNPVTSSIDSNIAANNIKKDVTILGVTGTLATGAYKVSSVQEMNALTDMEEGDYCIVKGIPTYVIPDENIVFSRFNGNPNDILNGNYNDYMFLIRPLAYESWQNGIYLFSSTQYVRSGYYAKPWYVRNKNDLYDSASDSFTLNPQNYKEIVWLFEEHNNQQVLKTLNGYPRQSGDYQWCDCTDDKSNGYIAFRTLTTNAQHQFQFTLFSTIGESYIYPYFNNDGSWLIGNNNFANVTGVKVMKQLYYCRMQTTTVDHLVYQYNGSTWIDVTDDILVPQTTITPTTSAQTPRIPDGYRGFKNVTVNAIQTETKDVTPSTSAQTITPTAGSFISQVNVSAVDNTIDANIAADNIKSGVTILGVTGTVIPDIDTHAYKVTTTEEMNAITTMSDGDYCVIKGVPTYVMPETATFTKFTGDFQDILSGYYRDYIWLMGSYADPTGYGTITKTVYFMSTDNWNNTSYQRATNISSFGSGNFDSVTLNVNDYKKYIMQFYDVEDGIQCKFLNNYWLRMVRTNGSDYGLYVTQNEAQKTTIITSATYSYKYKEYVLKTGILTASNKEKFIHFAANGTNVYNNHFQLSQDSTTPDTNVYLYCVGLYCCRLETTTVDHLVYQYREGTGWVDVTDEILVPTTNVTPSTSSHTVAIPAGYRGLKNVTVAAIQTETQAITPTDTQQTVTPAQGKFLTSVTVNATPLEEITVTATTNTQVITPTQGKVGISQITVNPVASSVDPNIIAENIKKGVTILGITGTYEGIVSAEEYEYQLETANDIAGNTEGGGE